MNDCTDYSNKLLALIIDFKTFCKASIFNLKVGKRTIETSIHLIQLLT